MKKNLRIASTDLATSDMSLALELEHLNTFQDAIANIEKYKSKMDWASVPATITGTWLGVSPNLSISTSGNTSTWSLSGGDGILWHRDYGVMQYSAQSFTGLNTTGNYAKFFWKKTQSEAVLDKKNRSHNIYQTNEIIITSPTLAAASGLTYLGYLTGITSAANTVQYVATQMNRKQTEKTTADFWYLYQTPNVWHVMDFSDFYDRDYGTPSFVICSVSITAEATLPTKITWRQNDFSTSTKQIVDVYRRAGESYVSQHLIPIDSTGKAQYYCSDSAAYNPPTLGEITVMGVI